MHGCVQTYLHMSLYIDLCMNLHHVAVTLIVAIWALHEMKRAQCSQEQLAGPIYGKAQVLAGKSSLAALHSLPSSCKASLR